MPRNRDDMNWWLRNNPAATTAASEDRIVLNPNGGWRGDENWQCEKYMEAVRAMGYPNPFCPQETIIDEKVALNLRFFDGAVWIRSIRALETGHGHGSSVLQTLVDMADRMGVKIRLNAVPIGREGPKAKKLQQWYRGFGFAGKGEELERPPREPKTASVGLKKVVIHPNVLHHGTASTDRFTMPKGPAWFCQEENRAVNWAGWDSSDRGPRRVLSFGVIRPLRLADTRSRKDWEAFCEAVCGNAEATNYEAAQNASKAGLDGWLGQNEVMLCDPSSVLRYTGSKNVPTGVKNYGEV
jgi:hypothetical protein